jgi:hypothetical protein
MIENASVPHQPRGQCPENINIRFVFLRVLSGRRWNNEQRRKPVVLDASPPLL